MSSFSPPRPDRRTALLVAPLLVVWSILWAGSAQADSGLDIVAVAVSAPDRQVTLVADVRPANGKQVPLERFAVMADDVRLPTRTVPVISDRPAIGLVVDASAAGATAVHDGVSGAANFLLQMPLAARTVVVADTTPPRVLAPLRVGAAVALQALSAVPVQGQPDTSKALTLVLGQLPPTGDGLRVVVVQTSRPDAGGEPAANLAERLQEAHVVLSVVTTGRDTDYWTKVTAATGGVVVAAPPAAPMTAFDDVAAALRTRYVVTFAPPEQLPARVAVQVRTADGTLTADAVVPKPSGAVGPAAEPRPVRDGDGGIDLLWLTLGIGALVVTVALLVLRRPWQRTPPGPVWTRERPVAAEPETEPETETEVQPSPDDVASPGRVRIFDVTSGAPASGSPVPAAAIAVAEQRARAARAAARPMAGRAAGEAAAGRPRGTV